jgi:hypothetical protein
MPGSVPSGRGTNTLNRADLQQLAEDRVLDTAALINVGRWSGAYYLAGYAVECAFKACIAKQTGLHDFPDKAIAQKSFTHNVSELLDLWFIRKERAPGLKEADMLIPIGVA